MDNDSTVADIKTAALRPSVVKNFSIEGLFGYRSISLDSKYAATILIAKNGSGKTTLLGSLDAFLRGQFTRLATLDFQSISCSLDGISEVMRVEKTHIDELMEICNDAEFSARAKAWELEPPALLELMELDFDRLTNSEALDHPIFYAIYLKIGNISEAKSRCKRLADKYTERIPHLNKIRSLLSSALAEYEIVYLPTYRRIELSIPSVETRYGRKKKSILARLGVSQRGLHTGDINFGLSDISDRLADLYRDIQFQSNQGYGKVSANIINDLVTGDFDQSVPALNERPSKEALKIFFERIKDVDHEHRFVGPYSSVKIPDIDKIYSESVPVESKKFLDYFLGQLNSVIQKTQGIESTVEQFITNCNKYLSGDDLSTKAKYSTEAKFNDDKVLIFNKQNLRITVSSRRTNRKIPLDALSSGEKQMISLFAQLYLYPKKKLVLIDEPELSLSLDWQRKILPDILSSVTCRQVIAITHSPFIFDNELEPFAASLRLSFAADRGDNIFPGLDIDEIIANQEDSVDD